MDKERPQESGLYRVPPPEEVFPRITAGLEAMREAQRNPFHRAVVQALRRHLYDAALRGDETVKGLMRSLEIMAEEEAHVFERDRDDEPLTTTDEV